VEGGRNGPCLHTCERVGLALGRGEGEAVPTGTLDAFNAAQVDGGGLVLGLSG